MTIEEARKKIEQEFIDRFHEFLKDVQEMKDNDFGWKYGIILTEEGKKKHSKNTQANCMWFQANIFNGRYLPKWEKEGYDKKNIFELERSGFLSFKYYSSNYARDTGTSALYYISQATAKEIYKAYR